MKHLWETEHPYYATEGCYYARTADCHQEYPTWDAFLEDWADADLDYNVVYRFDWHEGEDYELPEGCARVCIFMMQQRKARPYSVFVNTTRDREADVIAWLKPRFEHMLQLWSPLSSWRKAERRQCARCWRVGRFKAEVCSVCAQYPTRKHKCANAFCSELCQAAKSHCWRCRRAGLESKEGT